MLQYETIQEVNDMRILEYLGGDNHVGMQGCRIEIIRKATDTSFKYEVSADFRSDDIIERYLGCPDRAYWETSN